MKLGCYNLSILVFILSINNDIIYNITKEGNVIKSLKNIEGLPVLPRAEFNFTLGNG